MAFMRRKRKKKKEKFISSKKSLHLDEFKIQQIDDTGSLV